MRSATPWLTWWGIERRQQLKPLVLVNRQETERLKGELAQCVRGAQFVDDYESHARSPQKCRTILASLFEPID